MAVPASAGRTHRRWREHIRPNVLAASDICSWCGHPGARAVDHIIPKALAPELAHDPTNLAPIHGREGCDHCPRRLGKRRVCNGEKGSSLKAPPQPGSRQW